MAQPASSAASLATVTRAAKGKDSPVVKLPTGSDRSQSNQYHVQYDPNQNGSFKATIAL